MREGLTLIEILVVIALIGVISTVVVINNKRSVKYKLTSTSDQLLSDIKRVRNMATSRVVIPGTNDFPIGGYGLMLNDPTNYKIVAYTVEDLSNVGDPYNSQNYVEIATTEFDDDFKIVSVENPSSMFYFRFFSENQFDSDIDEEYFKYVIKVAEEDCTGICEYSEISIGEETPQGFVWANAGINYITEYINPIIPGSCFLAGTKVLLADYSHKNIEDIQIGDIVMGYSNNRYIKSKVLELESPFREGYYVLSLVDGKQLKLTNEHPIYIRNAVTKGWASLEPDVTYSDSKMKVFKVKNFDEVFSIDGWKRITNIEYIAEKVKTYNLKSVQGNTFFADGVLAHNKGGGMIDAPTGF